MDNPLKPILTGLDHKLAAFEREARKQLDLLTAVRNALPSPDKDHVVAAAYEHNTLVIATDSPAWSARLRFYDDLLRQKLGSSGETAFAKLQVKVGRSPTSGKQYPTDNWPK